MSVEHRLLERIPTPSQDLFYRNYFLHRRPVIIVGAVDGWSDEYRSFDGLARRCGQITLDVDRMGRDAFVFERERRTASVSVRFRDFVNGDDLETSYAQCRADPVTACLDLQSTFLSFAPTSRLGRIETLWIGGGAGYGLHQDIGTDQFLCQLRGRKQVLLVPDTLHNVHALRLEPLRTGRFYRSTLPFDEAPDSLKARDVQYYGATLGPGDVLYIPCAWFHALEPLEPCISIGHRHIFANRFAASAVASVARHIIGSVWRRYTEHHG